MGWDKVAYGTKYSRVEADHIPSNFLKAVFHKIDLVHS